MDEKSFLVTVDYGLDATRWGAGALLNYCSWDPILALRETTRQQEKMAKIKAGGYPLPEDWSPRGELP